MLAWRWQRWPWDRSSPARADDEEDRAAAQQIADMLRDSGQIRNYNIAVKYKDGMVRLDGRVTSQEQMNSALMLVSDLDNVQQIVNGLTIGPGPKPAKHDGKSNRRGSQQIANRAWSAASWPVPQGTQAAAAASPLGYQQARQAGYPRYPPGPMNISRLRWAIRRIRWPISKGNARRERWSYVAWSHDMSKTARWAVGGWPGRSGRDGRRWEPAVAGLRAAAEHVAAAGRVRSALHAELFVAELRRLSELRRGDLSEAVFGVGLALHRPVLSLSASAARLAQSVVGMG